jgi:DNA-binding transcriptional MocR family regulator
MSTSLPEVSPIVVDAICEMLISDQGMLRPPEKAAKLLALIVELYKRGQPFPRREEVAQAIGASVSTIDAALSTRLDEGYITLTIETPHGNVQRRNSAIRERHYVPSQGLLAVADKATKDSRRVRQRTQR